MQDAMTVYFDGEKSAGLLIAGIATRRVSAAFIAGTDPVDPPPAIPAGA
jgi:hypothetical protein